jgi:hypothetical protein
MSMNATTSHRSTRSRSPRRRIIILAAAPALAMLLVACGDDTADTADTVGSPSTAAPTSPTTAAPTSPTTDAPSVPPSDANTPIEYPGDRNTAVLRVEFEGGFVPPGVAFAELPALVVSGDMLVYEQGVTTQEFPGALVRPVQVRPITPGGIQRLLTLADEAGLLAPPPDYTGAQNVADAADTVVTINAGGSTFVHRAYALGLDSDEQSPQRRALAEFVDAVSDVEAAVGESELGEPMTMAVENYRLRAIPVLEDDVAAMDPEPARVAWPDSAGVMLRDAADCAIVTSDAAGTVILSAKQDTVFMEGDGETASLYQLAVAPVLPGDPDC